MSKLILTLIISLSIVTSLFPQATQTISLKYKQSPLPFGLVDKKVIFEPSVGLVLSGGGARGLAQIGVLRALTERNIPIDHIVGTSMGSILGGLYSAGYTLRDLDSIVRTIPWNELLTSSEDASRREMFVDQKITDDKALVTFRLDGLHLVLPTAINTGQRLSNYLNLLTLNAPIHVSSGFDLLRYDFRAVCTDLITGNIVVLNKGSLSQAMRASASVSLFMSPVKQDSLLLVDGGLVANVPVQLAKDIGSDYIIAFNTTSPLNSEADLAYPWNVADQLISIPMKLLTEQQLKIADLIIAPNLGNKRNTDFTNIDSIIYKGYVSTLPLLDKIQKSMKLIFNKRIDEKEYYLKNIVYDSYADAFARPLLYKYSRMDSVSNFEIMNDLYNIYKNGDFDSISVRVLHEGDFTQLKFMGEKNPVITQTTISGISLLPKGSIDALFSPLIGMPYNTQKVLNRLMRVLNIYRSKGYSLAELENVRFDKSTGILSMNFSEGIISRIIVDGNVKTRENIIRREFPVEIGDTFRYDNVQRGLANLRSTNLFNDITLTANTVENKNILTLRVSEKLSSLLRFGLRIDNENQTQISMDIRDENVLGTATELGMILSGGIRNRSYILEHKANRIFNTYLIYKIRGFYEFNDVYSYRDDPVSSDRKFSRSLESEYREIYKGVSIGLGTQVARFGNLIAEVKYQNNEIKNKRDYSSDLSKVNITTLSLLSTIDSQDKYPFPNKGFLIKTSYETAQKFLFGDVSYTKFCFDYSSFFTTPNEVHSFSPRFVIGFADRTLPLSQEFSLGGQNSFFGMRNNEYRGRQIMLASLQYRIKLPVKIFFDDYFSLRYDLGSIWETREQIRFADLKHGLGATLSFDTPLGPADFSIGRSFIFKKDLPGSHLSLGQAFFYFTIGYYY